LKHFLVSLTRVAPELDMESMDEPTRRFLREGLDKGLLLMAGPSERASGLVLVARADSQAALAEWLETSPLWGAGHAQLDIVGFEPECILEVLAECSSPGRSNPHIDLGLDGCAFI
jgi:uncharacterized protein YciI